MKSQTLMVVGSVLVLMSLKPIACRAQAEIAPDQYNANGIDPVSPAMQTKTVDISGNFSLPFDVKCAGRTLSPGTYVFSVRSFGKGDAVTLIAKGNATQVQARMKSRSYTDSPNALLLGHEGQQRTLTAISLKEPGIMLYLLTEQPRNIEANPELVPISYTARNKVGN